MSMDFVYDLKEKLDEQNIEYLLMICKTSKKEAVVDTFYAVSSDEVRQVLCSCMDNLCEKWEKHEKIDEGEDIMIDPTYIDPTYLDPPDFYDENEDENEDEGDEKGP